MAAQQDATQIFVEQLSCPVCYELFGDRILQCSLGHSICSDCFGRTQLCAQCRQPYTGTRNFLLEEMVKQLIQMKRTTNDIPANSSTSDDKDKVTNKELAEKLSKQLAKLIEAVPKSEPIYEADDYDETQRSVIVLERIDEIAFPNASIAPPEFPAQPRGWFTCRILNCDEQFASCRMLNHIRSLHPEQLVEHRLENVRTGEYVTRYDFKCGHFRRAIRINQWGLFFVIVNVKRKDNKTIVSSWIQCVGRKEEAKWYKFELKMKIGEFIAEYNDYSYADTSDAAYIETKKQCLFYETPTPIERVGDVAAELKICKTAERTSRRSSTTQVTHINSPYE